MTVFQQKARLNQLYNEALRQFASEHNVDHRTVMSALSDARSDAMDVLDSLTVADFVKAKPTQIHQGRA